MSVEVEDGFWQDILENPDDDSPRLIYADWLDDQGDQNSRALAEFIRLQIELEHPPEEGPHLWEMRRREAELLRSYRGEWVGPLREQVLGEEFRRGFVETVTLAPEHFLDRAEEIMALAPVRRLRLTGTVLRRVAPVDHESLLLRIADSPHLRQLVLLRLQMPLSVRAARALAESPHLSHLDELEVQCQELTEAGLRALLQAPLAARLRRLRLGSSRFDPAALHALAAAPALAGLVELAVHANNLAAAEVQALAMSECLTGLRKLDLSHNHIGADGVGALASGPLVTRLEELTLAGNWFSDEGAAALAGSARTPQLTRLDLGYNRIHAAGVEALALSSSLAGVKVLNLRGNVTGNGLAGLARSPNAEQIRVLLLHFNGISDGGVQAVAESGHLRELVWLDLNANRITSSGARALVRSAGLHGLARLELERNDIGPKEQQELLARFGEKVSL
jgi:uncharacterized protein (TIGR02996 family)